MGKNPGFKDWEKKTNTNAEEINLWPRVFPHHGNTGLLTQRTPTLDIDILNAEAADVIETLARERFEERGYILVRTGLAPKRAIPFRTDTPFKKITANVIAPGGPEAQKIEFLADGQQFVAFGIHPDTRMPYSWFGGEPGKIKHEDLPYITGHEAKQFVTDAVALLVKGFGYTEPPGRPKMKAGNANGDGAAKDWGWLADNILRGRDLHDSLRDLAGKLVTSGMSQGAAINQLRGLMENCTAPHDARWNERLQDIPRLVAGAVGWKENTADENKSYQKQSKAYIRGARVAPDKSRSARGCPAAFSMRLALRRRLFPPDRRFANFGVESAFFRRQSAQPI
jgi:hypothetical protein